MVNCSWELAKCSASEQYCHVGTACAIFSYCYLQYGKNQTDHLPTEVSRDRELKLWGSAENVSSTVADLFDARYNS